MKEDDQERPEKKDHSALNQFVVNGTDHAADNQRQTNHTETRHHRLYRLEHFTLAIIKIKETADSHRNNGDDQNIQEHPDCINIDRLSCKPKH